jgi:hypothetical protein
MEQQLTEILEKSVILSSIVSYFQHYHIYMYVSVHVTQVNCRKSKSLLWFLLLGSFPHMSNTWFITFYASIFVHVFQMILWVEFAALSHQTDSTNC